MKSNVYLNFPNHKNLKKTFKNFTEKSTPINRVSYPY